MKGGMLLDQEETPQFNIFRWLQSDPYIGIHLRISIIDSLIFTNLQMNSVSNSATFRNLRWRSIPGWTDIFLDAKRITMLDWVVSALQQRCTPTFRERICAADARARL